MLWLQPTMSNSALSTTLAICRAPALWFLLVLSGTLGFFAGLESSAVNGELELQQLSPIVSVSGLLVAVYVVLRWSEARELTRRTLGTRAVLVSAGAAALLVAAAAVAALIGGAAADSTSSAMGEGVTVAVALGLFALRWGALVALLAALPLAKWGSGGVAVVIGWLLPRAAPSLGFLDPGAPLHDLGRNGQTFAGCIADTGAILAFGVAAILLGRRFRPTS